jgi:hypothetical protein
MNGTFPFIIQEFTSLTSLNIGNNVFANTTQFNMSRLANLQQLNMFGLQLGGTVPSDISKLTKLQYVQVVVTKYCCSVVWECTSRM